MAAATCPAWVRLVVTLGTDPARPSDTATARMAARTRRSRKVISPMATNRISGMNTTDAYRASKALLVRSPPTMAAARVPATTMAIGRPSGRVRMSSSMWRRSVATPNRPKPARAKNMRARARPLAGAPAGERRRRR